MLPTTLTLTLTLTLIIAPLEQVMHAVDYLQTRPVVASLIGVKSGVHRKALFIPPVCIPPGFHCHSHLQVYLTLTLTLTQTRTLHCHSHLQVYSTFVSDFCPDFPRITKKS